MGTSKNNESYSFLMPDVKWDIISSEIDSFPCLSYPGGSTFSLWTCSAKIGGGICAVDRIPFWTRHEEVLADTLGGFCPLLKHVSRWPPDCSARHALRWFWIPSPIFLSCASLGSGSICFGTMIDVVKVLWWFNQTAYSCDSAAAPLPRSAVPVVRAGQSEELHPINSALNSLLLLTTGLPGKIWPQCGRSLLSYRVRLLLPCSLLLKVFPLHLSLQSLYVANVSLQCGEHVCGA